jgi:EAL domain-containing protein (putative c-di-GMP-specific phosphodiesterase class I)
MRVGELPEAVAKSLEVDLVTALDRGEIQVLFQPQYSCATSKMIGAEALARWHHPTLGEVGARDLFAIAEKAAMVAPLSRHIVTLALEMASHWPEDMRLSLNITPEELAEAGFAERFAEAVSGSGFVAERLTLEVTEDILLTNLEFAAHSLGSLKAGGYRIALDDFGAGFCNFSYLKLLPLDVVKLDRSMIDGIDSDPRDLAVLRAIVALCKALGLDVVAEGIENEQQLAAIIAEGCAVWQGFLRSEPIQPDAMLELAEV